MCPICPRSGQSGHQRLVRPNARVEEVASILLASRISAVPAIDEQGELLGIVSEGDLMRRAEAGTERRRSWWLEHLTGKQVLAAEYVKSHSHKVSDVMTRSVITATPETPLGQIATLLEKKPHQTRADRAKWKSSGNREPRKPASGPSHHVGEGRTQCACG
jgi:CBS domain-containing protein